jgi:hypothetical protein
MFPLIFKSNILKFNDSSAASVTRLQVLAELRDSLNLIVVIVRRIFFLFHSQIHSRQIQIHSR